MDIKDLHYLEAVVRECGIPLKHGPVSGEAVIKNNKSVRVALHAIRKEISIETEARKGKSLDPYVFAKMKSHMGHAIDVVGYGDNFDGDYENMAIECTDCGEVIFDLNKEKED